MAFIRAGWLTSLCLTCYWFWCVSAAANTRSQPYGASLSPHCGPGDIGFNVTSAGQLPANTLRRCGVALLRGAVKPEPLTAVLDAFNGLNSEDVNKLRYGRIREKRDQIHLPFARPFDELELLGTDGQLAPFLVAALGEQFVLDLVTLVTVPPGAAAQDPHKDLPKEGSIGAHIPLHALTEDLAPVALCGGTHELPSEDATLVTREALLWRPEGETSSETKRRLLCGGRQKTHTIQISCKKTLCRGVKVRDSRLGASVFRFTDPNAETLGWQLGDEITHAEGRVVSSIDDWFEILDQSSDDLITVRLERPDLGPLPDLSRLVLGAPLEVGDVLLYDSRTWHWGTTNSGDKQRYVLYVNFKSTAEHEGVHPEAKGTSEFQAARTGFQQRLVGLKHDLRGTKEL